MVTDKSYIPHIKTSFKTVVHIPTSNTQAFRLVSARPLLQSVTGKLVGKTVRLFPAAPKESSGEARGEALRQARTGTSKAKSVLSEIKIDAYMEAAGTVSLASRRAILSGLRVLDRNEARPFEDIGLSRAGDAYHCRNSLVSSQGRASMKEKAKRKRKVKDQNCLSRIVLLPTRPSKKKTFPGAPPARKRKTNVGQKRLGVKMS